MRILFEEHQYDAKLVRHELDGISTLQDVEQRVSVGYVGYYYNNHPDVRDCVFILPKVLLEDVKVKDAEGKEDTRECIAGLVKQEDSSPVFPEDIITPEGQEKYLDKEYRKFIYEFAVWVYRALCVYRKQNPDSKAIYYKRLPQEGRGKRHQASTYLDIILSLIRFNRENQNFFLFTIKNLHSGLNKINWTRTIAKSPAIIQNDSPVYLNPVNKKRQVNFDEELFIIFFSILNYVNDEYGFRAPINCQYELITGKRFGHYLKGFGRTRLRQIKYKYFSDKAVLMWELCYAFFDAAYKLNINTAQQEYLLAKKFEVIFEAMIDDLIGEKEVPAGLKEQEDGKRVDHMYTDESLTTNNGEKEEVYYIGDSKYYKASTPLGRKDISKQYTYARNVVQWNINLFLNDDYTEGWDKTSLEERTADKGDTRFNKIRLRKDDSSITEGYNVIPNFFISAFVKDHKYDLGEDNIVPHIKPGEKEQSTYISYQFPNRLFDRDTLILSHYDVNFLYVLYLYARQKNAEKSQWKKEVRRIFRDDIRKVLEEKFDFYAMRPKTEGIDEEYIKTHFKDVLGKIYTPYEDKSLYSVALSSDPDFKGENDKLKERLGEVFWMTSKKLEHLGDDPTREEYGLKATERRVYDPVVDPEAKSILVCPIALADPLYGKFESHIAKKYNIREIPAGNIMDIKYFVPVLGSKMVDYYKVESISFSSDKEGFHMIVRLGECFLYDQPKKIEPAVSGHAGFYSINQMKVYYNEGKEV